MPKYDVLIVDAFSEDGIPIHLVTREALFVYKSRLKANGIIAFHISNHYYDLKTVLKALALDISWAFVYINAPTDNDTPLSDRSSVFVMSQHTENLLPLINNGWEVENDSEDHSPALLWTDDYNSILTVLKVQKNW